ncbi:MAG: hypothetical protein GVY33_06285, partial [Alphaproteobacteria bacterium]|nr:hypothetical protein [Alphaproteobacteria bacterium]
PAPRDGASAFARSIPGGPFAGGTPSDTPHRGPTGGGERAGANAPAAPAAAVRGTPFTPPALERAAAPALAATVAARVADLAGLGGDGDRPVNGTKLQAFADGLPVALPAAARQLSSAPARLIVAVAEGDGDGPTAPPRRLVLEVELPHLGRVRLDGLADGARFDVLVAPVPEAARPGLRALWAMVRARTGLSGDLAFPEAAATRS